MSAEHPSPRPVSPASRHRNWRANAIVALLALFAFAASLFVSRQVFENAPHLEDEVAYLFQAKVFARGQVTAPLEFPQSAFWQPFVIESEAGERFSKYPPGWSMLLAVGVVLGVPALVNAVLAALNVFVAYRLGRDAFNTETGVIAAALMTFSPMALLLNGTLMAHTAALFFATLFMWAYLRMSRADGRFALAWGVVAGASLGVVVIIRPLSAAAVALPFVVWSGIALIGCLRSRRALLKTFAPLLALSAFTLLVAALLPLYNYAATSEVRADLYTLVPDWEYDRVGFGPEIGRNGHTLTKGVAFASYDLSLTAADLFGWQAGGWSDMLTAWVNGIAPRGMVADSYWPVLGLSWILLPFGLIVGFRREWSVVWVIFGALWLSLSGRFLFNGIEAWAAVGVVWALVPLAGVLYEMGARYERPLTPRPPLPRNRGEGENDDADLPSEPLITHHVSGITPLPASLPTWLLFGVLFALVAVHTAYWIGSQRYSTRYYAEGLSAAAILSALPLAWLIRRGGAWRVIVPVALTAALMWSYFGYSVPRISALQGYNRVTRQIIDGVEARRDGDRPALVLITGIDARWRTRAALWTVASPFLDGEIEVAFVNLNIPNARESILARLPGRQIIEIGADVHDVWFMDTCGENGCELANPPVNPTLLFPAGAR